MTEKTTDLILCVIFLLGGFFLLGASLTLLYEYLVLGERFYISTAVAAPCGLFMLITTLRRLFRGRW